MACDRSVAPVGPSAAPSSTTERGKAKAALDGKSSTRERRLSPPRSPCATAVPDATLGRALSCSPRTGTPARSRGTRLPPAQQYARPGAAQAARGATRRIVSQFFDGARRRLAEARVDEAVARGGGGEYPRPEAPPPTLRVGIRGGGPRQSTGVTVSLNRFNM